VSVIEPPEPAVMTVPEGELGLAVGLGVAAGVGAGVEGAEARAHMLSAYY